MFNPTCRDTPLRQVTKTKIMNGLKNFVIGALGALGIMEITDAQILSPSDADPQSLITRPVITLLAGVLSALLSRWFRKHKPKHKIKGKELKRSILKRLFRKR